MNKIPKFILLRAFEAAARLQSFTLAAQELHLTQSAISHQVRELEGYFGRPLFIRKNRSVEPTPEGARLQANLSRVFDALEAACNEVALTPSAEVLNLYCAPSFAAKWLGPRLPEFMEHHPDITIRLSTGAEPIDLTRVQDVDVAITYVNVFERPGVDVIALGKERTVPLCAPGLLDDRLTASQQITELPLIESQLSHTSWSDWFTLNGLRLPKRPRPSFDRAALVISAAVDGMGVALESVRLAEREILRGELIELGRNVFIEKSVETHFFSCRTNERKVNKIRLFKSWLLAKCEVAGDD
ncbi:LysR substrate-binding domain-containing protein [Marinobacterium litorale]|uniref:LysR substrate-binding domain-containing protein n=1 Tax=Marinobacterium litorale TaxID=404770 RepID=UPI0004015FBA|nr:LysR substrate-binding domain-containing protein [Marinobacterium litorale]